MRARGLFNKSLWALISLVVILLAFIVPASQADIPGWDNTGSMGTARTAHTATLLENGKVLIAGNRPPLSLAELYDPLTGTFTPTGAMGIIDFASTDYTATLLANGKVLIGGGLERSITDLSVLTSAELYDPGAGTFTPTGAMGTSKWEYTATLLANGKVLVAGGFHSTTIPGGSLVLSSAELYDPGTGRFISTGAMGTARYLHTATRLTNGKVLVAGGETNSGPRLSSAEVYDPATGGGFTPTGAMGTTRTSHTATLLENGKVLVAGGETTGSTVTRTSSAELYDPLSGTFTPTGAMGTTRILHTATRLTNGKVLVAGGVGGPVGVPSATLSSTELYDPRTGTFTPTESMITARCDHNSTLLSNGKVLVTGGTGINSTPLSSAEVYTPELGTVVAPIFSPTPGTYTTQQSVTITTTTSGATIRYTTDGSTPNPTTGMIYTGPIPLGLNSTTTLNAVAYLAGWANSPVSTGTYTITSVASDPPSGGGGGGGGGGCSISPEGRSKGESPLGTMLALLSPGIMLIGRRVIRKIQIRI